MKKKAIIVDIDGTLANTDHRNHLFHEHPIDWDKINAASIKDKPNEWCVELMDAMYTKGYDILFVTGRSEKYRDVTKKWLDRNKGITIRSYKLMMRANEDTREDDYVKEEIYLNSIKDKYDILFVIDDRKRVVDGWRRLGLTCLQCQEGNY